jgi:hypothetical protein
MDHIKIIALELLHTDGQTFKNVTVALLQDLRKQPKEMFDLLLKNKFIDFSSLFPPISESPHSRRQPQLLSPAYNKHKRLKGKETGLNLYQIRVWFEIHKLRRTRNVKCLMYHAAEYRKS